MPQTEEYFASLPKDEIGDELVERTERWYEFMLDSVIFDRMRRSYRAYYGLAKTGDVHLSSQPVNDGIQGELTLVKVNQYRSLIQNVLVMTTSSRPSFNARATNTDFKSQSQTILANGILDFFMREKKLETIWKTAVEHATVFGEGYVAIEWDPTIGDPFGVVPGSEQTDEEGNIVPGSGEIRNTGDVKYTNISPLNVVKDCLRADSEGNWLILRKFENRFDVATKYEIEEENEDDEVFNQELRAEVTNLGRDKNDEHGSFGISFVDDSVVSRDTDELCDEVPVFTFYHNRTESLPNGRMVIFIETGRVLFDGPLPYTKIPVFRISPSELIDTPFGYTSSFDLLSLQEMYDSLHSTIITNQSAFGVQNVLVPRGHNIDVSDLGGGLNLIEFDPKVGKPETLNLLRTSPEIFNYEGRLEQLMQTLIGVNSVSRGNPEASLRSGSALALVQSMAIQFNSGLQQSAFQLLEEMGTFTIQILRDYATTKRIAFIAGKNDAFMAREFSGDDLQNINRVTVDAGSSLQRTSAGKLEIAQNLLQNGLIRTPDQFIQVLSTGKLDPLIEGQQTELLLIKQENEQLSDEENQTPVAATAVDDHRLHISEHKSVLANPEARLNPTIVQRTLEHISQHIELLRNVDPELLQMIGQQPLQGPPQQASEAPGGGTGAPQGAVGDLADISNNENPLTQQAAKVNQPNQPQNPLGGQFDAETGGLSPETIT